MVSVLAEAAGCTGRRGIGCHVQRTLITDTRPAPESRAAWLARLVLHAHISRRTIACGIARALGRRDCISGAIGVLGSTETECVLWALGAAGCAIETGIACALCGRIRHGWGCCVGRTKANQSSRAEYPRLTGRTRRSGCSISLVARQTHTLRHADRARWRGRVGRAG